MELLNFVIWAYWMSQHHLDFGIQQIRPHTCMIHIRLHNIHLLLRSYKLNFPAICQWMLCSGISNMQASCWVNILRHIIPLVKSYISLQHIARKKRTSQNINFNKKKESKLDYFLEVVWSAIVIIMISLSSYFLTDVGWIFSATCCLTVLKVSVGFEDILRKFFW